jgi:uncharacterized protein
MAISQELLDLLVCPICKTPVELTPDETGLRCATCRIIYPIRDGFPVMIRDEAKPEPGSAKSSAKPEPGSAKSS